MKVYIICSIFWSIQNLHNFLQCTKNNYIALCFQHLFYKYALFYPRWTYHKIQCIPSAKCWHAVDGNFMVTANSQMMSTCGCIRVVIFMEILLQNEKHSMELIYTNNNHVITFLSSLSMTAINNLIAYFFYTLGTTLLNY